MKVKAIKVLSFLFFSFFSNSVFSTSTPFTVAPGPSVGTFTCSYCPLSGPRPDDETLGFIKSDVNPHVNGSWLDQNLKPKSVTICNATHCAVYQYIGQNQYTQLSITPITSGGGGGGGGFGSGGGGFGSGGGGFGGGGYFAYIPIYVAQTSCIPGYCETHMVLVGYEKIFIPNNEPQ
jgi:uncharacterized membrane protein YgcG